MKDKLKRLISLGKNDLLGLDIGSSSVKMVQLRKVRNGYSICELGIEQIETGNENEPDQRKLDTVKAIQQCLTSSNTMTRLAVSGLCGPEVAVRYFRFPTLPAEEVEGAVTLEASQVCPFSINDCTVDYQLIPNKKEPTTGVLVAATNKLISEKSGLVNNATLNCVLMDVEGLALLNCLSEQEKSRASQTLAVLNIGSTYTTLAIAGENNMPFIRDITYAGDDIIKNIASETGRSVLEISKILTSDEDADKECQELTGPLDKACKKLVTDINETLRYYTTAQQKNVAVEKLFVCGGFALVNGFVELLNAQLDAVAELWNPLSRMRCDTDSRCRDIIQKKGAVFAVAAGLAMRSI